MIKKRNRMWAIFFIAFFAVNIILPSIIFVHFKINQEYIAANLCVEKDIEESTCAGNCQLKKKLDIIEKGTSDKEDLQFNVESHISFLYALLRNEVIKEKNIESKFNNDLENKNPMIGFYEIPFRPPILL